MPISLREALTLDDETAAGVAVAAAGLSTAAGGRVDDPRWLAEAGRRWHDLPGELRKELTGFRRDSGRTGSLLVRGLPVDPAAVPPTPLVRGSAQRTATVPASLLMLLTNALGFPIAYRPEKSGAMVHDVIPVPGSERFQGNEGSVLLNFHNENAFHPHRPDYVLLLCLRADHDRVAGLRTASIRQVYDLLPDQTRAALFRREFVTAPPPSFGQLDTESEPHAVLTGAEDDPDVLVDFAATEPLTPAAREAMAVLRELFAEHADTHHLVPGDLAVVDNRVTVHGRTAFLPRYDGCDRWLQRTFATQDLRRSRRERPADGHVLVG